MPKIGTKVVVALPEPEAGDKYKIVQAKMKTTQGEKDTYSGIEVKLSKPSGGEAIAQTMLWYKEEAGENSKLGCFVQALGDDTDTWVGKTIQFLEWKNKKRSIKVF